MSAQPNERRRGRVGTKAPPTVMVGHAAISTKGAGEPIVMVGLDPTIAKGAGALTVMVGLDPTIAKDARRRASP